jgi:hypothetical protein
MLIALLQNDGRRSTTESTRYILAHDESQIEYHEDVTKKHGRARPQTPQDRREIGPRDGLSQV